MRKAGLLGAIVMGVWLSTTSVASAQVFGFGYGRGYHRSYTGFGLGFGGYGYGRPSVTYRNAFTGDVAYAERETNDFRHDYEKRRHDPLGIKSDVQRLDESMEKVRREADRFGSETDRGADLMRDVVDAEDRIDRRFRRSDDDMSRQWQEVRRIIDRLAREYRID